MALSKVTYVDGETVIGAQNLNAIQDEIIANGTNLGNKVDKVEGKGLSTNDYTTSEKTKLSTVDNTLSGLITSLKSGDEEDAEYHLGFYLDANGDLCQTEDDEDD